jgi:hypothetical protein
MAEEGSHDGIIDLHSFKEDPNCRYFRLKPADSKEDRTTNAALQAGESQIAGAESSVPYRIF